MARRMLLAWLLVAGCPAAGRADVWYEVVDLGRGFAGIPRGLNSFGQTAGHHGIAFEFGTTPVTWDAAGKRLILPTLGGNSAYAFGLNDGGLIVGASRTRKGGNNYTATMWLNGTPWALPSPAVYSAALGVNAKGKAAGYVNDLGEGIAYTTEGVLSSGNHAAVWVGGDYFDLSLPGERESTA